MPNHFHSGFTAFVFAGVSAVLFIQLTRLGAAWAVTRGGTIGELGKAVGGAVTFTGASH